MEEEVEVDELCDFSDEASSKEEGQEDEEEEEDMPIHTRLKLEDMIISDTDGDDDDEELGLDPLDDGEDELPPILEPPSTGYLHTVNENLPPPYLQLAADEGRDDESSMVGDGSRKTRRQPELSRTFEVVDLLDSDEGSSNTDSDDELVKVNYVNQPPEEFKKLLLKYQFLSTRDTWIYNLRSFYKKQPSRIRRLLKMHRDAEGNPVEEPIEMLFEKINAERERMNTAQNVKNERDEGGVGDGVATVASIKVASTVPKLTHVLYPGNVVNNDKAVETLGGIGTVSKIFEQPNKKLLLKFRAHDPFANGANAQGRNACGLLLRVRRRKVRRDPPATSSSQEVSSPKETEKINLDLCGLEPLSTELIHDMLLDNQLLIKTREKVDQPVTLNGKKYQQDDLLMEDRRLSEEKAKDLRTKKAWTPNQSKEYNLKLPKILETKPEPTLKIETLGVIHRSYEFNGICDFQYLPVTKKADGKMVSIKDKIFPILGAADNPEKLVMKEFTNEEAPCQTFSLPPAMSRIDNPPRGLIEELIVSDKTDSATRRVPPDDSIFSSRMKRIIYTISYNFQADANAPESSQEIPSQPLSMALKDIERRQIKKDLIEVVRLKFEERFIWSKVALEFATKIPSQTLKYIIPNFAYFAANGPWRNTWIKFGLDPRKNPIYVIYQSVDFRIPFIYRRFMNVGSKNLEGNHKYLPEHIPPKTQMFYQLCDIKLQEIRELIQTLESMAVSGGLVYDERFGFLKEGSYEYFRYIMNYYLENLLQEHGKIPASSNPDVTFVIPPGHIEPEEKVKAAPHRRVKMKRIRKNVKKSFDAGLSPQTRLPKGRGKKPTPSHPSRSYQETLEDLALNKQPSYSGSDDAEIFEEEDDDEEEDEYYVQED